MSDMATLERRLAVLEDIEAIRQLKHRYFFMCDRKRPADVLATQESVMAGPLARWGMP